jgi:hypothetical protein
VSRFLKPELVRLDISGGDWILIKKRLSAGEKRNIFVRMVRSMKAGEKVELDPAAAQIAQVAEYLVDWSLADGDGQVVNIRGVDAATIKSVLDNLDADTYSEIEKAVEAHIEAMEQEKKIPATGS